MEKQITDLCGNTKESQGTTQSCNQHGIAQRNTRIYKAENHIVLVAHYK